MHKISQPRLRLSALFAAAGLCFVLGCSQEGPAERTGENIDEAAEETKEAVTPDDKGPLERAGEKADEAGEKLREGAENIREGAGG